MCCVVRGLGAKCGSHRVSDPQIIAGGGCPRIDASPDTVGHQAYHLLIQTDCVIVSEISEEFYT